MRRKRNRKKIPINLLRQQQRVQRHLVGVNEKPRRRHKPKFDNERIDHEALVRTTENRLKNILQSNEILSDISCDCTPEELLGEIAIAKGYATTIYVERDGLSTLTVTLSQKHPTIANLKRAIESTARLQHKRELRERYESRRRRRHLSEETGNASNSNDDSDQADNKQAAYRRRQQLVEATEAWLAANRSTGELVHSTTRCGHPHRSTVSWRFLWRAYILINVQTKTPLYDNDGRKLLIDCGIENGATLRFSKREIYMKRRRQ